MRANRRVDAHSTLLSRSCSAEGHCSPLLRGSRHFLSEAVQNCHSSLPLPEACLASGSPAKRGHTPATLMEGKNKNVRFVASRCRMSKCFSKEAGSVVDPEIPTPRRVKLVEGFSPGRQPIRMQRDTMHLEWIRDSSTPRAYRATQDSLSPLPDGSQTGRADHGRSVHNSLHRD
jgi:hypothetical protein